MTLKSRRCTYKVRCKVRGKRRSSNRDYGCYYTKNGAQRRLKKMKKNQHPTSSRRCSVVKTK